jgi:long-chain acyl-CoA synthetase
MSDQSLARMFWNRVEKSAGSPAQKFKQERAWKTLSWREVGNTVRELAAGLVTLGRRPGDAVGILSTSRRNGCRPTSLSSPRVG